MAFLTGWVIGLVALTTLFIGVSGLLGGMGGQPPTWTSWVRIVIGVALIAFGIFRWLTRHSKPHQMPGTKHVTEAGPVKAFAIGAVLTVANPKVLFVCAAAGLAIGSSGLGHGILWVAEAVFVAVAGPARSRCRSSALWLSGDRLDPYLDRLKVWMEKHNAALVAAILVVIGLLVLYKGIHGL